MSKDVGLYTLANGDKFMAANGMTGKLITTSLQVAFVQWDGKDGYHTVSLNTVVERVK